MTKQTDNSDGSKVENDTAISATDLDKVAGGFKSAEHTAGGNTSRTKPAGGGYHTQLRLARDGQDS